MRKIRAKATVHAIARLDAVLIKQEPLPEKHPFYALIGRVVAEWARLEHELDLIIWDLAETDRTVNSCMTGQITSYASRFEAIAALAELRGHGRKIIRGKKIEDRITDLRNKAGNLAKQRNRYIHDAWFLQTSGDQPGDINEVGQFTNFSIKNKKFGFRPIAEEEILKFIQDIKKHSAKASKLRSEFPHEPKP